MFEGAYFDYESFLLRIFAQWFLLKYQGSTNLEAIQIIKKAGGSLKDSFLDEGWVNWPYDLHITDLSFSASYLF